jgi:hypothetical protein
MQKKNDDKYSIEVPRMCIKRIKGNGEPIAKILPEIAQMIAKSQFTGELCELVQPRKKLDLSEESITSHINWLNKKASESIDKTFILYDGRSSNRVFITVQLGYHSNLEIIWVTFNPLFLQQADVTHKLIELISQAGQCFNAFTGYVYQSSVAEFNYVNHLPITIYDSSKIPSGIWWINYWNQEQVNSVGREIVMQANWHESIELSSKSIVSAATLEFPDLLDNPIHIYQFEHITKILKLRTSQSSSKPSEYFWLDSV